MISLVLDRTTDVESREQLQVAQSAAQSLVTLLNDILDLSKIEAGKMTLETLDFDLPAFLARGVAVLQNPRTEKEDRAGSGNHPRLSAMGAGRSGPAAP